ncbi:hypothetical protein Tco_1012893 [Tanacetum coccineum]
MVLRCRDNTNDTDADSNATLEPVYVKDIQTQDNSTKDDPSDRGSKLDPEGIPKGRDATMNKLNEDADPNEGFPDGDKIGKELPYFAPSPYYIAEGLTLKELSNRMNVLTCLRFLMEEQTLIIVRVNEQDAQVEHLSAELAKLKGSNHALEKVNHSRWKKYKKYKAEREFLVLEKEKLENELLEILTASKKDKESYAKGKSQLDLQETEQEDLNH